MTGADRTPEIVRYWLDKAAESLVSARDELNAGRLSFCVNRSYYAAFYAASALLLSRGKRFSKHSGVRSALHQHVVKPGELAEDWGRFYDNLFYDRNEGDYLEFVEFDRDELEEVLTKSAEFVRLVGALI